MQIRRVLGVGLAMALLATAGPALAQRGGNNNNRRWKGMLSTCSRQNALPTDTMAQPR